MDKKEKSAERKRNRKKHKRDHDTATAAARKVRCKQRFRRGRGTACEWTDKASKIFRKNPKFLVMRKLTDMVMGEPNFLPNPCAILCPFDLPL